MKMAKPYLRRLLLTLTLIIVPAASWPADERQSMEELRNTVINLLQALVDQGVITREKAEQMVKSAQDKAAANAAAAAKADEGAVRVPYVPDIVKDEIAKEVAQELKPEVVTSVVKEAKDEKWGVPGALPDWLSRIRLSGNATLREEDIMFAKDNDPVAYLNYYAINQAGSFTKAGVNAIENTTEDRVRFRGRFRLALDASITDSITTGARLVTGNTSDLVSETQTLDGTAPYQFGLDELYIRLDERNSQKFPWLSVVGGRFLNPYGTPTDLIFHKDLTFDGLAMTGRFGFGNGSADQSHVFMTLGAHPLQEVALSGHDKWLTAAQLGTNLRWGRGQSLRVAAAFFDYFNVTGRLNPPDDSHVYDYTAPTFERQGNTYFDISNSPDYDLWALASKFRLANVNATYTLPVDRFTFGVSLDAVRNFGFNEARVAAEVGPNTVQPVKRRVDGYQAEVSFGTPTVLTAGAWRALLGYRYLQSDAVIDGYTDSDFHFGGTNALGYYLIGDVGVANRVWVRLRYLSSNAIDAPPLVAGPTFNLGIDTVQLDLNTIF
jgi:hypothetical protein